MKNIHPLEKSSYAPIKRVALPQHGTFLQYGTFLHIGTYIAILGLVIYFHVPKTRF
jgi:hypothetical protein